MIVTMDSTDVNNIPVNNSPVSNDPWIEDIIQGDIAAENSRHSIIETLRDPALVLVSALVTSRLPIHYRIISTLALYIGMRTLLSRF